MEEVVDMAVDERFMREALREAMAAGAEDEIPIGAVIGRQSYCQRTQYDRTSA